MKVFKCGFKPLFAFALMTALASVVAPTSFAPLEVSIGIEAAEARRSGGRSGGGSFSRPRSNSSPSRSNSSGSSGSNTRTAPSRNMPSSGVSSGGTTNRGNTGGATRGGSFSRPTPSSTVSPSTPSAPTSPRTLDRDFDRRDSGGGTVIVPVPVPVYSDPSPARIPATENYTTPSNSGVTTSDDRPTNVASSQSNDDGGSFFGFLILLLIVGGLAYLAWRLLRARGAGGAGELDNDIVTVSKLQIGLLASAKTLQAQLTRLSEEAELDTPDGLAAFSTECSLALLRNPTYWVYAASDSETVDTREAAQQRFESISIGERMKFDSETFSRTGDRVSVDESSVADPDEEMPEYIVVTFVVGTEGDRPLFEPVHTAEALEAALKTIGSLTGDYLSVFELLWTPQTANDSLTAEELMELYPDITPL